MSETPNEIEEAPAAPRKKSRWRWGLAALVVCALLVVLAGAALLAGRYGALSPQGRSIIEARANGLKVGRFGRLYVEGLSGDIWRDFSVRRVVIRDPKGVWLEGRNLRLAWTFGDILGRRFHATNVTA